MRPVQRAMLPTPHRRVQVSARVGEVRPQLDGVGQASGFSSMDTMERNRLIFSSSPSTAPSIRISATASQTYWSAPFIARAASKTPWLTTLFSSRAICSRRSIRCVPSTPSGHVFWWTASVPERAVASASGSRSANLASTAIESVAVPNYASADWTSHCAGIDQSVG